MAYPPLPQNNKSITDAEIIEKVMSALGINSRQLGNKLQYKSPATVANVKKGYVPLSDEMIFKFRSLLPQVNEQFLRTGEGSVLSDGTNVDINGLVPLKDQFTIRDLKDVPNRLARIEANQNDLKEMFTELISLIKK